MGHRTARDGNSTADAAGAAMPAASVAATSRTPDKGPPSEDEPTKRTVTAGTHAEDEPLSRSC